MTSKTALYSIVALSAFEVFAIGCSSSTEPVGPDAAGASNPTAGARNTVAGAPGSSAGAAGAATGGGGASAGGASGGTFAPLCGEVPPTAMGAPSKDLPCTAADTQVCYKHCGPQNIGFKSETCTAGKYQEQATCSFPDNADYSCYKISAPQDATCPTDTIMASTNCAMKSCTTCTDATGHYYDSQMNLKVGYCDCPEPATEGAARKWVCASATAWPCPGGKGCTP